MIAGRLLGPPEVTIDGGPPPAELLWRKHVGLCLVLWCAPQRRRTRDQLVGLLWADKGERAARHSLNEALRVVRRAAGEDAIETRTDSVRWAGATDLDIDRFAALESSDPGGACALIAGPFCDGFVIPGADGFDRWLEGERARWRQRMVELLVRASTSAEDRGNVDRAVTLAEQAIGLDPHSEFAVQALMRAHWLRGERVAALTAGEDYRVRLHRDLGVPLDARTLALISRIGQERGPARPRPDDSPPETRIPLIAREAVLAGLLAAWRATRDARRPGLLVVRGAAGSGRSRIAEELLSRVVIGGGTAVLLRALEVDGADPDAIALGLAMSGMHLAPGVSAAPGSALAVLGARAPLWAERFPGLPDGGETGVHDAFTAVVRATAEERPLVLAIDDADRAHPDELRWLPALIRSAAGLPLTVVVTALTDPTPAIDELEHHAGRDIAGVSVTVDLLRPDEMEQLVSAALHDWPFDARARLARRVMTESGGAPAIAVDVLQAVQHGLKVDGPAHWPAPDRTLDSTLPGPLPGSLVAAIRLEFRRLSPDEQAMLSTAALLEEPFPPERLGRILGIEDPARRDRQLDSLERARWVVADGRGYSFPARAKRRLIADEMLTPGQRRRLAARIAACS